MEKALHLQVEDTNKKRVSINGDSLGQKALSLYENFSKESPEMNDIKPWIGLDWEI